MSDPSPTPTPTPTPAPSPTPAPTAAPTPTPAPTAAATPTPQPSTPAATPTPQPAVPGPTPTPEPTPDALTSASHDADANAGTDNVGSPASTCSAHTAQTAEQAAAAAPQPTPAPAPKPSPTPTPEPTGPFWVRLAVYPADAPNDTGSLRLQGTGGEYDSTLPIASSFVANEESVDVVFENVPTSASYTLTYIGGDGRESTLVSNAAYASLKDDSLPEPPPPLNFDSYS